MDFIWISVSSMLAKNILR